MQTASWKSKNTIISQLPRCCAAQLGLLSRATLHARLPRIGQAARHVKMHHIAKYTRINCESCFQYFSQKSLLVIIYSRYSITAAGCDKLLLISFGNIKRRHESCRDKGMLYFLINNRRLKNARSPRQFHSCAFVRWCIYFKLNFAIVHRFDSHSLRIKLSKPRVNDFSLEISGR